MEILSFAEIMIFWSEILLGKKPTLTHWGEILDIIIMTLHCNILQQKSADKKCKKNANKIVSSLDGNLCNQRKNGCKIWKYKIFFSVLKTCYGNVYCTTCTLV